MNSNYRKASTSLNNFDFDLGVGTNKPRSLNDQKNKSNSSYSSYSTPSSSNFGFSQSKPTGPTTSSWQPNKPSWTHQPAPGYTTATTATRAELGGPTSMVGDISGKSWNSTPMTKLSSSSGAGFANKDPKLFGDLVSSALGQNKGSSSGPLKGSKPVSANSSFSMGGMGNSLPKTADTSANKGAGGSSWEGSDQFGSFVSAQSNANTGYNTTRSGMNKPTNLGGPSTGSSGGGGSAGIGMRSSKDLFSSLGGFSKPSVNASLNSPAGKGNSINSEDINFGDFQAASNLGTSSMASNVFPSSSQHRMGGFNFSSVSKGSSSNEHQAPIGSSGGADPLDMFFTPSSGSGAAASGSTAANQQFSGGDDWGIESEFGGGGHDVGGTTELEGLPPPPVGVSASTAKNKGLDNYKQGQFADAIKWLSWAVILLEKAADASGSMEVLSCRASCYKEVGEYKKAVADCTKILDDDAGNVAVLVQRALLYESMEKYKLGAEDLRTVMKLDPGNRVARSTIHRLTKMAEC